MSFAHRAAVGEAGVASEDGVGGEVHLGDGVRGAGVVGVLSDGLLGAAAAAVCTLMDGVQAQRLPWSDREPVDGRCKRRSTGPATPAWPASRPAV
jgi:hypothetical protein